MMSSTSSTGHSIIGSFPSAIYEGILDDIDHLIERTESPALHSALDKLQLRLEYWEDYITSHLEYSEEYLALPFVSEVVQDAFHDIRYHLARVEGHISSILTAMQDPMMSIGMVLSEASPADKAGACKEAHGAQASEGVYMAGEIERVESAGEDNLVGQLAEVDADEV